MSWECVRAAGAPHRSLSQMTNVSRDPNTPMQPPVGTAAPHASSDVTLFGDS